MDSLQGLRRKVLGCSERHRLFPTGIARRYNLAFNERPDRNAEISMPEDRRAGSNRLFSRRQMLGTSGKRALAGIAGSSVSPAEEKRPRVACVVTYWAAPGSHADWIITKLLDGYWWKGAHTPSRVDVVSVYIHQLQESGLGQKVCKAKGIPSLTQCVKPSRWRERNLR